MNVVDQGHIYPFTLTRVINGDTVEGIVDVGFDLATKQRFRLQGVIAPSLRSKDKNELERAKAAKMWLQARLDKKRIIIQSHKTGKFGKYLATLFVEGSNVNQELLSVGHAAPFGQATGGKNAP